MASKLTVDPVTLMAGAIGLPLLANVVGRTFIAPKDKIATEAEANEEFRRLARNFAIFNALAAAGLGYATAKAPIDAKWKSATLGGAMGTGMLAAMLGGALLTGPSADDKPAQVPVAAPPPVQVLPAGAYIPAGWVSSILGYPRKL